MSAVFDSHDHCTTEGYATYHTRRSGLRRFRLRCWLGRHVIPVTKPHPPNGHSPSNYWQCPCCHGHMHFYVVHQHRFGSYDRDTALAYSTRKQS